MKGKRLFTLVTLAVCALAICLATPQKTEAAAKNVKKIYTVKQLKAVSKNPKASYILMKNLDLKKQKWTPLCTSEKPFTGTFNGNKKKITGLKITGSGDYRGLFAATNGAKIYNLTVSGQVIGKGTYTAGIVGEIRNKTKIYNCKNYAHITGVDQVGGIAGRVNDSTIYSCANFRPIKASGRCCGGITSDIYPSGVVYNSSNLGEIKGGNDLNGGISGGATSGEIKGCNNSGNVTGSGRCGAISGDNASYAGTHNNNIFMKTKKINAGYDIVGSNSATYSSISGKLSNGIVVAGKTYTKPASALSAWAKANRSKYGYNFVTWVVKEKRLLLRL